MAEGRPARPTIESAPGPTVSIYLAGKITKNGWRRQFVPGLREAGGDEFSDSPEPVDLGTGIIYNGPFFVSCDHGCAHGDDANHALLGGCINTVQGEGWTRQHGGDDHDIRSLAVTRCLDQIRRSQLVLAVVEGDAHGTLVEIGYAVGIGKKVLIATSADCGCVDREGYYSNADYDDGGAWFPFHMPGAAYICCIRNAITHLEHDLARTREELGEEDRCESPVELAFLRSMRSHAELAPFKPNVPVMDGKYRIDFADSQRSIGIEIDGHQFHSDKESFAKDRVRQRELEVAGWRIVRYSGQEVHRDAEACVTDLRAWLAALA